MTLTQRNKPAAAKAVAGKAESGNRLEARAMNLFEPVLGKKHSKMLIRSLSAVAMGAVLAAVLSAGHLAFAGFLLLLQVGLFSELVNVRYEKAKEIQVRWTLSTDGC